MSFILAMAVSTLTGHPKPGKDGGGHPKQPLRVTPRVDPAIASLSGQIPPRRSGDL